MGRPRESDYYPDVWKKVQESNSTATSFTSKIPTITQPTGNGVIVSKGLETLRLMPFGGNDNNETGKFRVLGWSQAEAKPGTTEVALWVPRLVLEITGTLDSTAIGVANTRVLAADLFCDTITVDYGIGVVFQGSGQIAAMVETVISGFELIEVLFDRNSSSDDLNALYTLA